VTYRAFISAVIVQSGQPSAIATFYRDALGIPLKASDHDGSPTHYECELGDIHFAVHPLPEDAPQPQAAQRVKFALAVADLDAALARLNTFGIVPRYAPEKLPFATITAIEDPDGNIVELTQLSNRWLRYLGNRPAHERDVVEYLLSGA
jgi:predicted enzyme related to lactoylglutathione lyase